MALLSQLCNTPQKPFVFSTLVFLFNFAQWKEWCDDFTTSNAGDLNFFPIHFFTLLSAAAVCGESLLTRSMGLCDKRRFPEEAIFTSATFRSADSLFAIDYSTNSAPVQERAFEEVFWLNYWGMKNEHKSDFFPTRLNFSFFALLWRTNFPNYSACYIRDPPDRDAWRVDFRHSVHEKSW